MNIFLRVFSVTLNAYIKKEISEAELRRTK